MAQVRSVKNKAVIPTEMLTKDATVNNERPTI